MSSEYKLSLSILKDVFQVTKSLNHGNNENFFL